MTPHWPTVKLAEVLQERQETPDPEALASGKIRIVSKIGFNDGLIQFRSDGETKTGMILIRPGDLVVSGINAGKGAIAIYSEENTEPAAATIHYGAYIPNKHRVDVRFLWWLLRSNTFRELLLKYVPGGIKTELKAKRLLPVPVPLPPLAEQRRIVVRIEQLAAQIAEARRLRLQATEEADALFAAQAGKLFEKLLTKSRVPLGKTISFRNDLIRPVDGKTGPIRFVGLQHIESHTGRKIGEDQMLAEELTGRKFKFFPGDVVYGYLRPYLNKVWIADCDGYCSVDQYVIQPDTTKVETRYLGFFMRSSVFLRRAIELTHNLLLPRLRTALLESIELPLPPVQEQRRIVAYLDGLAERVAALKQLQTETAAALDALLPSILDKAFKGEL